MKADQAATKTGRDRSLVLVAMCLALATVVSAVSSLNVALPDIARDLHASLTQLQWVVDAYAVVFSGLLLLAGALGDRLGRRPLLLGGLVLFAVAAACGLAIESSGVQFEIGRTARRRAASAQQRLLDVARCLPRGHRAAYLV